LYQKRVALQNLQHITNTLNKIERLLNINRNKDKGLQFQEKDDNLSADMVERIAADIHHLNYCMQVCKADAFFRETQPRLKLIGDRLQQAMERQLLEAILSGNEKQESLRRCLRIYATVDRVSEAEELVRRKVIAPYLEEVISEKSLNSDPQGLKGVFQRVLKLTTDSLKPLILLTQPNVSALESNSQSSVGHHVLKDFDFLVRAMWPEVVEKFEDNLSSLFSAGNPDRFHTNFTQSMEFLNDFEKNLVFQEDVENFRQINSYNNFVGRWSLAVYYQIRFREIALPVEISMDVDEFLNLYENNSKLENHNSADSDKSSFKLASTNSVIYALEKCWSPSIFLPAILHRFWKLNLQIIARYSAAISKVVSAICKQEEGTTEDDSSINSTSTDASNNLSTPMTQKGHTRSASDQNVSKSDEPNSCESNLTKRESQKDRLVLMYLDINDLSNHIKTKFFDDTVHPVLLELEERKESLKISIAEGCDSVLKHLTIVSSSIVQNIVRKCLPHLNSVHDIQRLYRRTNRQVPCKACPYVTSVMLPIQQFFTDKSNICPKDILRMWCIEILSNVANEYLSVVSETLAAVQKMEESLKRLKKVRERTTGNLGEKNQDAAASTKISDDDKIRLQLYVDVKHFILQIEKGIGIKSSEVKPILVLENLVIEATKGCFDDYLTKIDESSM